MSRSKSNTKTIRFHGLQLRVDATRRKNFVYIGRDSFILSSYLRHALQGKHYTLGLDLGCASGIQAFTIAKFCKKVIATDVNPRALTSAQSNAQLNKIKNVSFLRSNIFASLKNKKFDLIVTNPPFVFIPKELQQKNIDGYGGGKYGMQILFKILDEAHRHLTQNGELYMIAGSPIVHEKDLLREHAQKIRWGAVTLQPVRHFVYRDFHAFHAKHGISHSILYILHIRKGKSSFTRKPLSKIKWLYDQVEMHAVKVFSLIKG